MLADALAPHGGVVMWRAFVYARDNPEDRAKQAYDEFKPLDGKFADNVHRAGQERRRSTSSRASPSIRCSARCRKTPLMMEFQITKEYLGFATHLAYLGPLFEEALRSRHLRARQGLDRRAG